MKNETISHQYLDPWINLMWDILGILLSFYHLEYIENAEMFVF